MTEQEKAEIGAITVRNFVDQFGQPDEYVTILLQVLIEELWNVSPLHILSQSEQEGNQTIDSDSIGKTSQHTDLQFERPETTTNMGNQAIDTD
jgi:hypothetical protein